MNIPNLKYFYNNKSKVLDVVLHGSSEGMDSSLIDKIIITSKKVGNSVVAFNFPYLDRGDGKSSGPELIEEIETLQTVLDFCKSKRYKNIRLIGKSLGGIVSSRYLKKLNNQDRYSIVIFGYVIGSMDLKSFTGKIVIIQGSEDKFGDIEVVKKDMSGAKSKNVTFLSVDGADHSYRNPETKEPIYEDEAVKIALK